MAVLLTGQLRYTCCQASTVPNLVDTPVRDSVQTIRRKPPKPPLPPGQGGGVTFKGAIRAVEKRLSNLTLAISEMGVLAFLSAIGTVVQQNQVRCACTAFRIALCMPAQAGTAE